jgi:hypothetical protein
VRDEHRLRVFENRVLRRIFRPKREDRVIKLRRMRWVRHVAHMGEGRGVYRVLAGRPKGKSPLGRPRRR